MRLVKRDITLDLTQSHSGSRRVFWVGDKYWSQVNRLVSQSGSLPSKTHGRWTFIHHPPPNGDSGFILEIPFISWIANKLSREKINAPIRTSIEGQTRHLRPPVTADHEPSNRAS